MKLFGYNFLDDYFLFFVPCFKFQVSSYRFQVTGWLFPFRGGGQSQSIRKFISSTLFYLEHFDFAHYFNEGLSVYIASLTLYYHKATEGTESFLPVLCDLWLNFYR